MQGVSIILLMVVELIAVMWVYGLRRLIRDIRFMLNRSTGLYWKVCWGAFNPLFLAIVFAYSQTQQQTLTYGTYVFGDIATGKCAVHTDHIHSVNIRNKLCI